MNFDNTLSNQDTYKEYRFIKLDSNKFGKNNYRVELLTDVPRKPFTKDQRNRIHRKLGIPSSWTKKFTWSKHADRNMINGLAINGNKKNFIQSIENVINEIIHCIAVGRIEYDFGFNKIDSYVQKLLISKIDNVVKEQKTTLQVATFIVSTSSFSDFMWSQNIPLNPEEIQRLETFTDNCVGDQKDEIIKKLRLFSTIPNYLEEIGTEIKCMNNYESAENSSKSQGSDFR